MRKFAIVFAIILGSSDAAHAADVSADAMPTKAPPPVATSQPAQASCAGLVALFTTSCPLSWYGITLYGAVDTGVAWQSHGTPFNGSFPNGTEQLISKNSNRALWLPAPNGMSQSIVGIKGDEPLAPGWSFRFDLELGFDPYSFSVANATESLLQNNGVPLVNQTSNGGSSRVGQFYNGVGYAGVSSPTFGTLTVFRQNSLTLDGAIAYDPMSGSYAFSVIGNSGRTGGVGDTEDARYSTAVKYRVNVGQFRAAALWQFGGYDLNNASTGAYQAQVGGDIDGGTYGKLSFDTIFSYVQNAVSTASLSAAQNLLYPNTLAATISDDSSVMLLGKYTHGPLQLFAGFEHIAYAPPSNPQTSFTDIGGSTVAAADINNTAYNFHDRLFDVFWVGAKYAASETVDLIGAYYRYHQNSYGIASCSDSSLATCSGALDAVSGVVDWTFSKKCDLYVGIMYSQVRDGLANGYLYRSTINPTVGLRIRF
jgi:predicted porin